MLVDLPHPILGTLRLPGIAAKLHATPGQVKRAPPLFGEHTTEVLTELGYSPAEIAQLVAARAAFA